jgi:hypothetical protein
VCDEVVGNHRKAQICLRPGKAFVFALRLIEAADDCYQVAMRSVLSGE